MGRRRRGGVAGRERGASAVRGGVPSGGPAPSLPARAHSRAHSRGALPSCACALAQQAAPSADRLRAPPVRAHCRVSTAPPYWRCSPLSLRLLLLSYQDYHIPLCAAVAHLASYPDCHRVEAGPYDCRVLCLVYRVEAGSHFVPGLPHVMVIELRQALISYRDCRILCLSYRVVARAPQLEKADLAELGVGKARHCPRFLAF